MRLVWVVIPLILIGIVVVEDSFASLSSPISSELSLSNIPKLGETAQLTITTNIVTGSYNYPTHTIGIVLPPGFELVDTGDFIFHEEYTEKYQNNKGRENHKIFGNEILISDSNEIQTITSVVTIKAIQIGDWRLHASASNLNITVGEEESFLVDYFPTKLSDLIGVATQTSKTSDYVPSGSHNYSKTEQFISQSTINLSDEKIEEIQKQLTYIEPSLVILNSQSYTNNHSLKKQLESGIAPEYILCKEERVLVIRNNGNVACVTERTAEKLIQRGWIFNEYDIEHITLYSSKLDEGLNILSSTPLPPNPFDFEVKITKLPKLGETVILTATLTLKQDNDYSWLSNIIPVNFYVSNGFDFANLDKSSSAYSNLGETARYQINNVKSTTPMIYQAEITSTQIGNWTIFVDGNFYQASKDLHFIVTADGTTLGEKPRPPSGIGRTVPAEDDFIISKIDPDTGEEVIIDKINSIVNDDYLDIELDPILYSGGPISSSMIKSDEPKKVHNPNVSVEPTITIGTNDFIISKLPRVDEIINATFIATYDSSPYPTSMMFSIDFHVQDGLEFVNIPDDYKLTYKKPQTSWGKYYPGIYTLSLPWQNFNYNETKSFTVQVKAISEGSHGISVESFDTRNGITFVIGSTETLLKQDYYAKYPDEIPEEIKIELPKTPEEQVTFEKKYGVSFGTTTIRTNITEADHRLWLENYGMPEDEINDMLDRIFPKSNDG